MSKESCREHTTRDHNNCTKPASAFNQVDELYAIGSDSYSWHILQTRRYKSGYKWEAILWYGTLAQYVHALKQQSVQTCGAQTPGELLAESKCVIAAISRALRPRFKVEVCS